MSPPFVFLTLVKSLLRPDFQVAAQNCWVRRGGAFTGEIRSVFYSFSVACVFSVFQLPCLPLT